jgi:hypothetical protein
MRLTPHLAQARPVEEPLAKRLLFVQRVRPEWEPWVTQESVRGSDRIRKYLTVELRVPGVCMQVQGAALLGVAGPGTGRHRRAGVGQRTPGPPVRTEVLKLATGGSAARGGDHTLIHPRSQRPTGP